MGWRQNSNNFFNTCDTCSLFFPLGLEMVVALVMSRISMTMPFVIISARYTVRAQELMNSDRIYSHLENEMVNFLSFLIGFSRMRILMTVRRVRFWPRDSRWWQRALFQYVLYRESQLWSAEAGEFSSVTHQWCYRFEESVILKGFWKPECASYFRWHWHPRHW